MIVKQQAVLSLCLGAAAASVSARGESFRPPAVPLVACDPYFSIWSRADRLTDADTTHWTGKSHRLAGTATIDGKQFRFMGLSDSDIPALTQTGLSVLPTRTVYTFEGEGVALGITFMTPALPDDMDLLARPVTYVTVALGATDAKKHRVAVRFAASAELAVNNANQLAVVAHEVVEGLAVVRAGSTDQPVLAKRGDDIRIDWGYLYLAVPAGPDVSVGIMSKGKATDKASVRGPGADLATVLDVEFGEVRDTPAERYLMLAYDDLYSIQYMKANLRPYWRRNGWEAADLLKASANEYETLKQRCETFDAELMRDLTAAGGERYAQIAALAYRQCFAAGKFVADANGQPLQFCKENHSNGCIATSDVFYPMSPQFLLFGPSVAKSFLVPFMNYAASKRWRFPFAPHDLGQYPHANGQRYGGGESSEANQMPVEESGNLLILMAAVAQMEGNADFASLYWPQLQQWAEYLKEKGFDPETQLCTDDFAGHLAHNVNLSVKAICGLAAFGKLCGLRGETAKAREYGDLAKGFADRWVREADDGDHYRLAFDKPGTWSQKYNLVWDRILGLGLFPPSVARTEMDHYRKVQLKYGLPLDNRKTYTKLDWVLWSATLTGDRADFAAIVEPVYTFLNETPDRFPMTDWYFTDSGKRRGFTARPVVGGVFLQMLYDQSAWRKYASRDKTGAQGWAPMPRPPEYVTVVPTAQQQASQWRYTTEQPAEAWFRTDFDDSAWQEGPGGFGTPKTPGTKIRTRWDTPDIWIRRTFDLPDPVPDKLVLRMHHDEDADVFLNGVLAAKVAGYTTEYDVTDILPAACRALRPGRNLIAIHCHQTIGGQYIDAGLDTVKAPTPTATTAASEGDVFLFSSFRGNGEDGLHLAYSHDGLEWTALKNDKSFLTPQVGGKLMRDPCIIQGPDGEFHMVWTTSWGDKGIGVAHSADLVEWSEQTFVPVMEHEPTARNSWAPEITWDPGGEQYVIYWATTIPGHFEETAKSADRGWNHRMYRTTTKDFETYTETTLFVEPGFNVIDATIANIGNRCVMVLKDETRHPPAKNLRIATSDRVTGPWAVASEPFSPPGLWVEGPTCLRVGDWWHVYFDAYAKHRYGAMRTKDFQTWEDISSQLRFPKDTRHGTAFRVPRAALDRLLKER